MSLPLHAQDLPVWRRFRRNLLMSLLGSGLTPALKLVVRNEGPARASAAGSWRPPHDRRRARGPARNAGLPPGTGPGSRLLIEIV